MLVLLLVLLLQWLLLLLLLLWPLVCSLAVDTRALVPLDAHACRHARARARVCVCLGVCVCVCVCLEAGGEGGGACLHLNPCGPACAWTPRQTRVRACLRVRVCGHV